MPYQRGAQYGYTVGPQIYVRFYLGTDFVLCYFVPFTRNSAFRIWTVLHCSDCNSWGGYSAHSGLDIVCFFIFRVREVPGYVMYMACLNYRDLNGDLKYI